ncbi:hypothetical protein OC846_001381 [Tilletia horrida]|uniref:Uncharacterized protein n=1 Tax=Tilletia horrida TaxID=155126 RepID=A0AAN6GW74_9BASI|nr:hypothetical protein OC845_004492 [Tilletia horrida]KAK0556162.1 hypothetical protein OC846_001381 [Tilletia horrida]KAK0569088.1 hypothetical protein OC861_001330 [Tilletia horrida]
MQEEVGQSAAAQRELSEYVLLLLSDSNLPTGGFIASAGLESYVVHGLLSQSAQDLHTPGAQGGTRSGNSSSSRPQALSNEQTTSAFLGFLSSSLDSYARSSLPFLSDVHALTLRLAPETSDTNAAAAASSSFVHDFGKLDDAYHSMVLNHVARRASCAQGIAFLTLFSKAFAKEPGLASPIDAALRRRPRPRRTPPAAAEASSSSAATGTSQSAALQTSTAQAEDLLLKMKNLERKRVVSLAIDALKLAIRKGQTPGHLPLCFGVFTAGLGLDLRSALHLHLFLQARALLSTAVRLNLFGPYLAHQMLLSHVRTVVDSTLEAASFMPDGQTAATSGLLPRKSSQREAFLHPRLSQHDRPVVDDDEEQGWAWDWADEGAWSEHESLASAPTTTWPLGEIAQARHDQLQSRLFNS